MTIMKCLLVEHARETARMFGIRSGATFLYYAGVPVEVAVWILAKKRKSGG